MVPLIKSSTNRRFQLCDLKKKDLINQIQGTRKIGSILWKFHLSRVPRIERTLYYRRGLDFKQNPWVKIIDIFLRQNKKAKKSF